MKFVVLFVMALVTIVATPALANFTDNFETNPFGSSGNWNRSGDVAWTGGGQGNDYVRIGQSFSNNNSNLWRSFTTPAAGEYCVNFDYRFVGCDLAPRADDRFTVQIGIGRDPLLEIFDATSSVDLTGSLFCAGDWQTILTPVTLEAEQTYWLSFRFQEAGGCWTPVTSLNIDNAGIGQCSSVVPAPGAMLLGSIGVSIVGWIRRRRII